jgi:hypothetical protein
VPGLRYQGETLVQDQMLLLLRRRVTGEMFFAVPCTFSSTQVLATASPFTLTTHQYLGQIGRALEGCDTMLTALRRLKDVW